MIRATIRCDRCNEDMLVVQATTWEQVAFDLATAMLLCHAAQPHTSHPMTFAFQDGDEPVFEKQWPGDGRIEDLQIECLEPERCGRPGIVVYPSVPIELVAAHVIAYHTAHEGHRMRCRWGVRSWESPGDEEHEP